MKEWEGKRRGFAEGQLGDGYSPGFYKKEENKILADLLLSFDIL